MNAKSIATIGLLFGIFTVVPVSTAAAEVPSYTVKRATERIVVDGILDESDWIAAPSFGDFVFPWWTAGEKEMTEAKMLWDENFLYLSFVCQDKHIWADHYNTNSSVSADDAAEIFWNPSPDTQNTYYQFEMNCIGNLLSVWKSGANPRPVILVPHIGRQIVGTVNSDSDVDSHWILEVAIRFSDYPELSKREVPLPGDMWRIGLHRCGGKTNLQYSQWSPSQTAKPNFHSPDDFGKLYFSSEPVRQTTNVANREGMVASAIQFRGNHPNPFNPSTMIEFILMRSGRVQIEVFNTANQKVRSLSNSIRQAGEHSVRWDGRDDAGRAVSSGTYLVRLRLGDTVVSRKMMLVR